MNWKFALFGALVASLLIEGSWRITWAHRNTTEHDRQVVVSCLSILLITVGYALWIASLLWGWWHL